jgi:uncharacterized membrane protein YidH (DUF202 family)
MTLEPDYDSLDPEERTNKFLALIAASLGVLSIIAGLIPICGSIIGLIGIGFGYFGMKSEHRKIAIVGIVLSLLGILISLTYMILVSLNK